MGNCCNNEEEIQPFIINSNIASLYRIKLDEFIQCVALSSDIKKIEEIYNFIIKLNMAYDIKYHISIYEREHYKNLFNTLRLSKIELQKIKSSDIYDNVIYKIIHIEKLLYIKN